MSELEIPLAMENDLNVEKAEAYTKDLEDVSKLQVSLDYIFTINWSTYSLLLKADQTMTNTRVQKMSQVS